MSKALRILCIISLLWSVISTSRCVGLQYKFMKSQRNVVNLAKESNKFLVDYNTLLDTLKIMVAVDTIKDVEAKIVTRTVTRTVYIKVPVTEQLPIKPAKVVRDSIQPRRGSSEYGTSEADTYLVKSH